MQFFTILWVCGAVVPHRKTTLKLIVMDTFFPHFNIAHKKSVQPFGCTLFCYVM